MKRGVTPIEDLLDLDEEERTLRNKEIEKISAKSIRNTGKFGGMRDYEMHYNQKQQIKPLVILEDQPPVMEQSKQRPELEEEYRSYRTLQQPIDCMQLSCLDICNHTNACPVCTRLYGNADRSIYIAVIVVLVIICILLLKRVMEMK